MYIAICGSVGSYRDVIYDFKMYKETVSIVQQLIETYISSHSIQKEECILLFAGSPCSDCISLELSQRMNIPVEYHLPCDGNPGKRILHEYENIPDEVFKQYLLSLFRDTKRRSTIIYKSHTDRNDAIANKCDILICVTTMPHSIFSDVKSGTKYVWDKATGIKYHYSLVEKTYTSLI